MSIAPCPYCESIPEIELLNPQHREFKLECKRCGLSFSDHKRDRAIRDWNTNWKEVIKQQMLREYE